MNATPDALRRWMVVDDDAALADVIAHLLDGLGLAHVERFTSPVVAWDHRRACDLVVTDRDMPGMDGLELARRIHEDWPGTKIVLITAHADDLSDEQLRRAGIGAVLPKPFTLPRLETLIRAMVCEPLPGRRHARRLAA